MADFDPYHEWLGIPPTEQPPHAYRLLGLTLHETNPKSIEAAAEQRTLLLKSRASGPHSDVTQKLLNEVQRARLLLLDDAKRTTYDAELRQKLKPSAAPASAAKPLPRAQALPEPVAEKPTGSGVMVTEGARRAQPATLPASSMPLIVAAAVGGALLLGGIIYWATRTPEKPPVVQKPPEVKPMLPAPRPMVQPGKQGNDPSPFVPAPMKEPIPDPGVKPPDVKPEPVFPPEMPDPPVAPMPLPTDPPEAVPAEPPKDERRPKPLPAEQEKALESFREIFKEDLAKAKKPDQWQTLLARISEVAGESQDDPATHFVLLDQTRQLAAAAGLWEPCETAIEQLAKHYQVDGAALRIESLDKALSGPVDAAGRKKLVGIGLDLFDKFLAERQVEQAVQLAKVLADPVRETRDKELTQKLAARKKRGGELFAAIGRVRAAREALKAKPDDAAARFELGKSLVLVDDWKEALGHLEHSGDPAWKAAAAQDAKPPETSEQQIAAADAWWDLAEHSEAGLKLPLQLRAAAYYKSALPQLTGIGKAKAERRLASLPADELARLNPPAVASTRPDRIPSPPPAGGKLIKEIYLDELDEDYARVFFGPLGRLGQWTDVSGRIQVISGGRSVAHSIYAIPYGNAAAMVQYDIGGAFTTFAGKVGFNENPKVQDPRSPAVFSIFGDGRLMWHSRPIPAIGETEDFSISIEGVHQLRLEVSGGGSTDRCHSVWFMPKLTGGIKPLARLADRLSAPRPLYLDDLVPLDWKAGHGGLGYFGATAYDAINEVPYFTLNERRVFHAVGLCAGNPAYVRYRLGARFRSLKTTAILQSAPPGTPAFQGAVMFRAMGDGKLLWTSNRMTRHGESQPCALNLTGVNELELSVLAESTNIRGWTGWLEPELEPVTTPSRPQNAAAVTADHVVIWNTHNTVANDRGTSMVNVRLYFGDQLVAQESAIRIPWMEEPSVQVRLPKKPFNRLRVEVIGYVHNGAGLNEIEVFKDGKNIAVDAIATASTSYSHDSGNGVFSPFLINDGNRLDSQTNSGYWMLDNRNGGWIELEWREAPRKSQPHSVLGYTLANHPHTAISFGDHWYLFFPGRITWDEAQRRCQKMGGYLACAEAEPEARFLDALSRRHAVWLGGRRTKTGWEWINGKPFGFTAWSPGEPNNNMGGGAMEDRIALAGERGWNDLANDNGNIQGYICEWEQ